MGSKDWPEQPENGRPTLPDIERPSFAGRPSMDLKNLPPLFGTPRVMGSKDWPEQPENCRPTMSDIDRPSFAGRPSMDLKNLPLLFGTPRGSSEYSTTPTTESNTPTRDLWTPSHGPDRGPHLHLMLDTNILKFPGDQLEHAFTIDDLCDSRLIGNGTFGIVFRRTHKKTGRQMAVKQIFFNDADPNQQRRLLNEHKIMLKGLACPNIVTVYGALLHEMSCLICMELMDTSLDILYRRVYKTLNQRLDEDMLGVIAVSVIDALVFLKTILHVAHRDVKPPNILVNRNGQVKMCDFGIVGELENSLIATSVAGCQPYLAPECIAGRPNYDDRSDVWSFGLTMYEISTGAHPFEGLQHIALIDRIMHPEPPQLQPGLPFNFSNEYLILINRCLARHYRDRRKFPRIKEMNVFYITHSRRNSEEARRRLGEFARDSLNNHEREE